MRIHTEGEEMAAKYYGVMMVNVQGLELLIVNLKNLKPLEHVKKDINLGDDVYQDQPVKYESVNKVSEALTGFVQILNDYGVDNYKLFGSSALHQAINSDLLRTNYFYILVLILSGFQAVKKHFIAIKILLPSCAKMVWMISKLSFGGNYFWEYGNYRVQRW